MNTREVNCKIAVDTMGGDKGPTEFIRGFLYATEELGLECDFTFLGNARLIERLLKVRKHTINPARINIHHTTQVIDMNEKPIYALKSKKDSSMVQAIHLVREGNADALVSCGNTGALMAGGTLRLRTMEGIGRPALGTIIPTKQNPCVLIDVGANPESNPENLVHNAILGSNYAKSALEIEQPRVGLLTIGTEEGKGNNLINSTHLHLQSLSDVINYAGLIEGFQVFDGNIDVIVCDGFVGNVLLKASEALFSFVGTTIKHELSKNYQRKIGAALSKAAFDDMRSRLSPDQHAGAPLLGLKGNILKSHGSSNYIAIGNALRIARELVMHDMIDSIQSDINRANRIISNHQENKPR